MAKLDGSQQKKLKELQQHALETARLAAEAIEAALTPPKPKMGDEQGNQKAGDGPTPPVPVPKNLEAIALIVDGSVTIAQGVEGLCPEC